MAWRRINGGASLTRAMRLNLISLLLYASMRCMMCGLACSIA